MSRGPLPFLQVAAMPEGIDHRKQKQGDSANEQNDDDGPVLPQPADELVEIIAHPAIGYTNDLHSATPLSGAR